MFAQKLFSTFSTIVLILLTLMAALIFSCSEQPTATQQEVGGGSLSGSGEIDPGASGSFLFGSVSDSTFAPGYIEVWAMDVAYDSAGGIVSFDVQLLNRTERDIPPPIHFVITDIIPSNIAVLEFDGVSGDGFPFYDFSSKLGNDNVLTPGERTQRVTMKFHTGEPRSFAIGFRIDLEFPSGGGVIAGVVYRDDNQNGVRDCDDLCEPGIPGITVALEKTLENNDRVILLTRTDLNGEYSFFGLKEGVYKVFVNAAQENWEVTSTNPLLITLVKGPDGEVQDFLGANFGLFTLKSLLLWNKLGSTEEVQNSEVGPNGVIVDNIEYLPCKYGLGFKPLPRTSDPNIPTNCIDYPGLLLGPQGCIEFWYHPDWNGPSVGHIVSVFDYGLPFVVGEMPDPTFLYVSYNDWQDLLGFNVYNGVDGGRDFDVVGVSVRPSSIPDWTTTEPFHIAWVWDGTAPNPLDRAQIYVNGNRVGTTIVRGNPTASGWPEESFLRLGNRMFEGDWYRHNREGADGIIDNIKIWSYPKTDFSDRFEE